MVLFSPFNAVAKQTPLQVFHSKKCYEEIKDKCFSERDNNAIN